MKAERNCKKLVCEGGGRIENDVKGGKYRQREGILLGWDFLVIYFESG